MSIREVSVARAYELMVVYAPEDSDEQAARRLAGLRDLLTQNGGDGIDINGWGRRRLAYPIKRHFEGQYVLAQFTTESGSGNQQVERTLSIDERVLRHLLVRRDT